MTISDLTIEKIEGGITRNGRLIAQTGSNCSADLASAPWTFDVQPGYGPGASKADVTPSAAPRQSTIPEEYRSASADELDARIRAARATLGDRVVILGHFYQRDEIVQYADFVGDSFQLARAAAAQSAAEHIVFCGVHFMAETADIVSGPAQHVILPNLAAGCSMADMADIRQVEQCWQDLERVYGQLDATASQTAVPNQGAAPDSTQSDRTAKAPIIPVTYMNSAANLKAFCGRHGGIVCTSSNARAVLEWAFERGQRVLFFPDQHLGRNTAKAMSIDTAVMPLWTPSQDNGGLSDAEIQAAKVILWNGFCSVHKRFSVAQIEAARAEYPDVRVIVHPECSMEVVDAADESGSTDYIVKAIEAAPAGTTFAIGTEINLVHRLAQQYPQHTIFCLDPVVCPCSTMYRIHPAYLAWVLESLVAGTVVNEIIVDADIASDANIALQRMLDNAPSQRSAQVR